MAGVAVLAFVVGIFPAVILGIGLAKGLALVWWGKWALGLGVAGLCCGVVRAWYGWLCARRKKTIAKLLAMIEGVVAQKELPLRGDIERKLSSETEDAKENLDQMR
jgi:hypothetical protein